MAWKLLTEVYTLPKDRMYITYFGGDKKLGLQPDVECKEAWLQLG
jgi:alanyl-tRNA synthetase